MWHKDGMLLVLSSAGDHVTIRRRPYTARDHSQQHGFLEGRRLQFTKHLLVAPSLLYDVFLKLSSLLARLPRA